MMIVIIIILQLLVMLRCCCKFISGMQRKNKGSMASSTKDPRHQSLVTEKKDSGPDYNCK
jgi:hypothetical protein